METAASDASVAGSIAERSPCAPGVSKPVCEHGARSAGPSIPNGRMGRPSSPHQQGREQDRMFVGVDVSKDRLDVHIRPSGTVFSVSRDEAGLSELVKQLAAMRLTLIVLEAT